MTNDEFKQAAGASFSDGPSNLHLRSDQDGSAASQALHCLAKTVHRRFTLHLEPAEKISCPFPI